MSIKNELRKFAESTSPGALALTGRWGVGKTYLWRQLVVAEMKVGKKDVRASYLSLFGIGSLSELKTALAMTAAEDDQQLQVESAPMRTGAKARSMLRWLASRSPEALEFVPTIGSNLARIAERVGFFLVRDRLICIDDLERRGNGLELRDVLGLVSFLVEEKRCRVIVILNDDHLSESDRGVWHSYREKVFRSELKYAPTPCESIDLGLSHICEEYWAESLRPYLEALRITNIRLIVRVGDFMGLAVRALGKPRVSVATLSHVAQAVTLLVYSVYGRGEGAPPIKRLMREFMAVPHASSAAGDNRSDEEKRWDDLIKRYGLYLHEPLDTELSRLVIDGYPDEGRLQAALTEFEHSFALREAKEAWHRAWDAYHGTFSDNSEEVVFGFESTWPAVSNIEHVRNLASMAEILRVVGRSDLATKYITDWVDHRRRFDPAELMPQRLHRFDTIDDPEIVAAASKALRVEGETLTLSVAWDRLDESACVDSAVAAFAESPVHEVVSLLESVRNDDLARRVRRILQLRGHPGKPEWTAASQNVQTACELIAARSSISAYRMKAWFGIDPARD